MVGRRRRVIARTLTGLSRRVGLILRHSGVRPRAALEGTKRRTLPLLGDLLARSQQPGVTRQSHHLRDLSCGSDKDPAFLVSESDNASPTLR